MGRTSPAGVNLRNRRTERQLTQREVAAAVGLSERQYQRLEANVSEPSWGVLVRLADTLGVEPHELFIERAAA